jgi:hypothetical protein
MTNAAQCVDSSSRDRPNTKTADLGDQAKSAALCFRSHQDALDYAAHLVESVNRLPVLRNRNPLKLYRENKVAAYVRINSSRDGCQYHLAFSRIPTSYDTASRCSAVPDFCFWGKLSREIGERLGDPQWNKNAVFLGITELVQGPKGSIPSLVWLEAEKKLQDFTGEMSASFPTLNIVVDFGDSIAKREFAFGGTACPSRDSGGVSALVKNGTQIFGTVEQDAGQILRDFSRKDYFVNFLSRLRILIDDVGRWVTVDKVDDHGIKVVDVAMCPLERKSRAMKKIGHEKNRPRAWRHIERRTRDNATSLAYAARTSEREPEATIGARRSSAPAPRKRAPVS